MQRRRSSPPGEDRWKRGRVDSLGDGRHTGPSMARMTKKRKKQEQAEREALLAPDAFEAQGETVTPWLERNFRVLLGLLVLGLGGMVAFEFVKSNDQASSASDTKVLLASVGAFEEAVQAVMTATTARARIEAWKEARPTVKAAVSAQSQTVTLLAGLYQAELDLQIGAFDAALSGYEAYLRTTAQGDFLRGMALEGKGRALEGKGDLKGALSAFRSLESVEGFDDFGALHTARVARKLNNPEEAKAALQRIQDRELPSAFKSLAEQRSLGL